MNEALAGGRAPWRVSEAYQYLRDVERSTFAWEWLRRTPHYRNLWNRYRNGHRGAESRLAREAFLAAMIDPALPGDVASPIWLASKDERVLVARPIEELAPASERIDVLLLIGRASVAVDEAGVEHWRFGDARRSVRVDLINGTLLGAPTLLAYRLSGLRRLRPKIDALERLLREVASRPADRVPPREDQQRGRWIAELRVADALALGASQQDIARDVLGGAFPATGWRRDDESYRTRVQRLVRTARAHMLDPLAARWF